MANTTAQICLLAHRTEHTAASDSELTASGDRVCNEGATNYLDLFLTTPGTVCDSGSFQCESGQCPHILVVGRWVRVAEILSQTEYLFTYLR